MSSRPMGLLLAAAALLAAATQASQPQTTVELSPAAAAHMPDYGESEQATLESAITTAVSRAMRSVPLAAGLTIHVTLKDVAPSRPTRAQLLANPSWDPVHTHFLGGAELAGEVRDASGHVLTTVSHRYFPPTLRLGSPAFDPWADARLAIDQFAHKVAAACRALPSR